MTTPGAGARISERSIGREYLLPAEVEVRARILPLQRARQLHPAVTCRNGALVAWAQSGDLPAQRLDETIRQHGHAILHTLGVANNELSLAEINVLHSEVQSFKQDRCRREGPQPANGSRSALPSTARTSARVSTTGRRFGRLERTIWSSQGSSISNTCL